MRTRLPSKTIRFSALMVVALIAGSALSATAAPPRVVAVGGALTEIVHALDVGGQLVGIDTTSTWPAAATGRLPKVGYQRALSAEGVLSLLLATTDAGPPAVIAQLRAAGVEVRLLSAEPSLTGVRDKVRGVARALGRGARN